MRDGSLDLSYLNSLFTSTSPVHLNPQIPILPFSASQVFIESGVPYYPFRDLAWWNATHGPAQGARREILFWPYRLNGGAMMICMAGDGSGNIDCPVPSASAAILLFNYPLHNSDYGTNKNRWQKVEGKPRQFWPGDDPATSHFAESGWPRFAPNWPGTGSQIRGPTEQAIEDGDIVVFCQENYSASAWITIQRTMEAE